jgi:hypothetical protein
MRIPESFEEFMSKCESMEKDGSGAGPYILELAQKLGSFHECDISSQLIVEPSQFAETLVGHFSREMGEDTQTMRKIEDYVINSGVEIGDFDNPNVTSYYGAQLAKDD